MTPRPVSVVRADTDDEHFPWSYTEYGVICACGAPMRNEQCTAQPRCIHGETGEHVVTGEFVDWRCGPVTSDD